jgi:hypothetical protein
MMNIEGERDGSVEMEEGKTNDVEKPSSSSSTAKPEVAAMIQKNIAVTTTTTTKEKKVKPEKREKRPYHYRTKKPRDMPKRPLSAYNYFFRTERGKIIADQAEKEAAGTTTTPEAAPEAPQEEGGDKKKSSLFATMGKTIAKRWKEIDPEELKEYKKLAEEDSKRYRREMDEYHMGRAKQGPRRKEAKDSPVSNEASAAQPTAPSFLEGISGLTASSPARGGPSAAQLQQQQPAQPAFGADPYLDQLLRLQQAQQGSLPPPQQQQLYEYPAMGSSNAAAGGGGGAADMSTLQSHILDAQLSRAMQQQQQRASLGLELYPPAAAGGQYAAAMSRQGLYGAPHQAMMDGALLQRHSQGMQPPAQVPALQQQQSHQQGIAQGGGGGGYDSLFSTFLDGNNARSAAGGGGEQQQLLLQQLLQQLMQQQEQQQQQQGLL